MRAPRVPIPAVLAAAVAVTSLGASGPAVRVVTPKNIEIFSVLAVLAQDPNAAGPSGDTSAGLPARFLAHRDHPGVSMVRRLVHVRSRNSLMRLALRLTDVPEARAIDPPPSPFSRLVLRRTVAALRDFHRVTGFEDYWRERGPVLRAWADRAEEVLAAVPVVDILEGFFGTSKAEYRLVYAPLMMRLRTGDLRTIGAGEEATVIFGPRDGLEDRGIPLERGLVVDIAFLEFGRLWINSIVDGHAAEFKKYAPLERRAATAKGHTGPRKTWRSFWIDNLAAAVQARLAATVYGPAAGPELLTRYHGDDLLAPEIHAELEVYENSRSRFPTIESFLKELLFRLESRLGGRRGEKRP